MKRSVKSALGLACLAVCLTAFPIVASAEQHHGHAHGTRGAGGAVIYAYPYPYDWDWWGWGGFWGPFYNEPYGYYPAPQGTVKLEQVDKDDQVYVNGSLAGDARHLKKMHLRPGTYSIEVKHGSTDVVNQQVYVTDGKTVKLNVGDKAAH